MTITKFSPKKTKIGTADLMCSVQTEMTEEQVLNPERKGTPQDPDNELSQQIIQPLSPESRYLEYQLGTPTADNISQKMFNQHPTGQRLKAGEDE